MAKSDRRRRKDAEQMQSLIKLYRESSMSRSQFCKEMDIAPHTFQYWFKKFNGRRAEEQVATDKRFITLDVTDHEQSKSERIIRITYPGGIFIELPV